MLYPDIEEARKHLAALQDLLDAPQPPAQALGKIEIVCGSMARALPDVICKDKLRDLCFYARELLSGKPAVVWVRGPLTPAEFLRVQIVKSLNAVDARLRTIQAIRRASSEARATIARSG